MAATQRRRERGGAAPRGAAPPQHPAAARTCGGRSMGSRGPEAGAAREARERDARTPPSAPLAPSEVCAWVPTASSSHHPDATALKRSSREPGTAPHTPPQSGGGGAQQQEDGVCARAVAARRVDRPLSPARAAPTSNMRARQGLAFMIAALAVGVKVREKGERVEAGDVRGARGRGHTSAPQAPAPTTRHPPFNPISSRARGGRRQRRPSARSTRPAP